MATDRWQNLPSVVTVPGVTTTVRQRIRAAMALADLDYKELAARIGERGLGERTLRKFTDLHDPRAPRPHELEAIARACGVPIDFLTDDPGATVTLEQIDRKLNRLLAALDVARPDLVDQLDKILTDQKTEAAKADLRARTGSPQRGSRGSRRSG